MLEAAAFETVSLEIVVGAGVLPPFAEEPDFPLCELPSDFEDPVSADPDLPLSEAESEPVELLDLLRESLR